MTDLPIIVSGVGRCGTSMVMAMLEAGGIKVLGKPPLYEQPLDRHVARQLLKCGPRAFPMNGEEAAKILHPFLEHLDSRRAYRFIWLVRDPMEQAKSQAKYVHAMMGQQSDRAALRKQAGINMFQMVNGARELETFSEGSTCLKMRFERILAQPEHLAKDLAKYVGLDLFDAAVMWAVVRKREPECSDEKEWE